MISRVLVVISVFLISNRVFGQADFYLSFTGAYPLIPRFEYIEVLSSGAPAGLSQPWEIKFVEEYKVKPGLNIEAGFDKNLKNRFSIISGIGFSYYQFKRELKLDPLWDNETDIFLGGYIRPDANDDIRVHGNSDIGETKILYLAIPVRLNYTLVPGRFKMGIGLSNYFVACSSQIKSTINIETQPISDIEYNDKSSNGLNNYQLAGEITLEYKVFKGIWMKAGYKNSFSPIFDWTQPYGFPSENDKAQYRTVAIGLKYVI